MATPGAERAFVDTNVLLEATNRSRPDHQRALAVLNAWPASGAVLYTCGQVLREYLVVATRPVEQNGLGLARCDAAANVRALRERLTFLTEDVRVSDRLMDLLEVVDLRGKQVHDANIVATMLVHGIEAVVTRNVADFTRFGEYIRVVDLRS